MDAVEIVAACREAKSRLAREMAETDPIEETAVEMARMKMLRLDILQDFAERGESHLTEDQKRLLNS